MAAGTVFKVGQPDQGSYDIDNKALHSRILALEQQIPAPQKRVAGQPTAYTPVIPTGGGSGGGGVSSGGTVTNFSASVPSWLAQVVTNPSTTPNLAITATGGLAANSFLATPDGATGPVGLRQIVAGDITFTLPYLSIVEVAGTPYAQEPKINFISGTNITVTAADNPGATRTDVTITATGGGGAGTTLAQINSGSSLPSEPIFNFIAGTGVTLSGVDDPTHTRTNITIDSTSGTTLAGDVTGPIGSNTISEIGGVTYTALTPVDGYAIIYNAGGATLRLASLAGDCAGSLEANEVNAIRNQNWTAATTDGQVPTWSAVGNSWVPTLPAVAPAIRTGTQATGALSLGIATTVAVTFASAFVDTNYVITLTPVLGAGVTTGLTYGVIAGTQTTTGFSFTITAAALITAGVGVSYVAVHL
jgi:hypothetical protein